MNRRHAHAGLLSPECAGPPFPLLITRLALPLLVTGLALAAYLLTRAPSISWDVGVSDSGELAAAAYVLGVPHPTGYPLYMLLGWAVSHVPIGDDPAARLTVLSALCGAFAAGLTCAITLALGDLTPVRMRRARSAGTPTAWWAGALLAGLGAAASATLWRQATAPETRTLALALALAILLLLLRALSSDHMRLLLAAWALWGLALADHLLCLALLPSLLLVTGACGLRPRSHGRATPAAVDSTDRDDGDSLVVGHAANNADWPERPATAVAWQRTGRLRSQVPPANQHYIRPVTAANPPRRAGSQVAPANRSYIRRSSLWLRCLAALLPGLCLYAYLPLRAAARPPLDWGDPRTVARFVWLVSGDQYRSLMGLSLAAAPGRLADRLATLWHAPGAGLLIAGCLGLALLCRRRPLVGATLVLPCLASFLQSAFYGAEAAPVYLLPCQALLCVGAGFALVCLWAACRRPLLRLAPALALVLLVGAGAAQDAGPAQALYTASSDAPALTFARQTLAPLPPRAVVLATGDDYSFALWYAQFARGIHPDAAVIDTALLAWSWYRDTLQRHYPWLRWGGAWQPDTGVPDPDARAQARETALVRAVAGTLPLYWTDPLDLPSGVCGLEMAGTLFRCVPLRAIPRG